MSLENKHKQAEFTKPVDHGKSRYDDQIEGVLIVVAVSVIGCLILLFIGG